MKKKGLKFYWLAIFSFAFLAAGAGFFSAQFSVDQAYASEPILLAQNDPTTILKSFSAPFTGGPDREPLAPQRIIFGIVQVALGAIATVFLVLTIYSGYLWWSAGGNEKQVEDAKKTLRNAIIGMFLVSSSYAIVTFIFQQSYIEQRKFGISGMIDNQEIEATQSNQLLP